MSWTKPCPSSRAEQVLRPAACTSSKNSSEVSAASRPSFLSLRPRRKPGASSVSTTISETPLAPALRIGLGDDDDQVGVLAVGDEGLRAVEHVAVAGLLRAWCARPAGRSRCRARSWRWRRPARRSRASAASAASAPRCRNAGCRARRCRNAAARRTSRSRRGCSSRLITASCAKVPPAPPYSSGIDGAEQARPRRPWSRPRARYMPSSCQRSICGTNSAAMKRRACSSSSTRSSVIQAGRGRLRASMANPVSFATYRPPDRGARAAAQRQ